MNIKKQYFPIFLGIALLLLPVAIFLLNFDAGVVMNPEKTEKSVSTDGLSRAFFIIFLILNVVIGGYLYWLFKK
jgi:hypothetical protein